MRDGGLQTLSGHLLVLGSLRPSGMLHRAKYSRFRNDSITSLEDGRPSAPLHVKVSALSPLSRSLPAEDVTLVAQDSSNALCTLIPKMANLKLSNPASLLGLRHFSLGTKEVPRVKLMESQTTPSSPISTEVSFSSYMATSPSRQVVNPPEKPLDDILLVGLDEPPSPDTPAKDLLCKSDSLLDNGMTYSVRYLGCIEVLQSMRSLDFSTRTHVTREAISRLCEVVPGSKGTLKKRKPPVRYLNSVLGKSNLQFSGVDIKLTISTSCLALMRMDTPQVIATHHMQCISFASGGDPDTTDYVAYVAKDPVNQRACHILECRNGLAQDVINTIGQAFELRFKQYLKNPISLMGSSDSETILLDSSTWNSEDKEDHEYYNEIPGKWPPTGGLQDARRNVESAPQRINCSMPSEKQYGLTGYSKCTNIYENCLEDQTTLGVSAPSLQTATQDDALLKTTCKSDLFDDPCYINTQALPITGCPPKRAACKQTCGSPHHNTEWKESAGQSFPSKGASHSGPPHVRQQVGHEDWFHGKLSRKAAESCLLKDGDFLVRESASSLSHQYVLSGLQGGQAKHLLLVDPEGKVRTKDHVFDNVGHLIRYHVDNDLPIISSGSELCLKQPVRKNSTTGPKV